MKYLYWFLILLTVVLRRIVFPLVYLAIPFRSYIRNVVYNYHLENRVLLKRLFERNPKLSNDGSRWILDNHGHGNKDGYVIRRKIPWMLYYLVLPLWLLLDDDANQDTYDAGFNKTIISGERKKWMPLFIKKKLSKGVKLSDMTPLFGNAFDLGDARSEQPLYEFWSVLFWSLRNPAYNFNYKFNQLTDPDLSFSFKIGNRLLGWKEDGTLGGLQTYSWEFFKKV